MGVGHGNGIAALVIRITAMAFDMGQGHIRKAGRIERLPEIPIEHRTARSGAPALALPAVDPTGEAIDQIFAVGADGQAFGARQLLKALQQRQTSAELHAVVGGLRLRATQLLNAAITETQQRAPASRPGVAPAGAITGSGHHHRGVVNSRGSFGRHHWNLITGAGHSENRLARGWHIFL